MKTFPVSYFNKGVEARISGYLLSGSTGFSFMTSLGYNFKVTQSGTSTNYVGNDVTAVPVTGLNDVDQVVIEVAKDASYFRFAEDDKWLSLNLEGIGSITTLLNSFYNLSSMTTFECDADLGAVTGMYQGWRNCVGLTSFPSINTASVTVFSRVWQDCAGLTSFPSINTSSTVTINNNWAGCSSLTSFPALDYSNATSISWSWSNCTSLTYFEGTLDFRLVTSLDGVFYNCDDTLKYPASTGTSVRDGDNALAGIWTNVSNGLISVWEMDETSGTVCNDSHGSNTGNITGPTVNQPGIVGKCYYYDGVNDRTNIGYASELRLNGDFSISIWMKPVLGGSSDYPTVFNQKGGWTIQSDIGSTQCRWEKDDQVEWSAIKWEYDEWVHAVITYSSGSMKAYNNGLLTRSKSFTYVDHTSTENIQFGRPSGDAWSYYTGYIDQTAVWNETLTQEQVTALYNEGNGLPYTAW